MYECDFIIKKGLEITQVIQVAVTLTDPKTRERELAGLAEAIRCYHPEHAIILTLDESETCELHIENKRHLVSVIPVWKWMLSHSLQTSAH